MLDSLTGLTEAGSQAEGTSSNLGSFKDAGVLDVASFGIYGEISIRILSRNIELKLKKTGLKCVSAGKSALVGDVYMTDLLTNQVRVRLFSVGAGAGGSDITMTVNGKTFGEFHAAGFNAGVCAIDEMFTVDFNPPWRPTFQDDGFRNVAKGTEITDLFVIDERNSGGLHGSPLIEDFDADQDDLLVFEGAAAESLPAMDQVKFKTVQTSKQLLEASEGEANLIYFEAYGLLYHDGNFEAKGFGDEGGIIAVLEGSPEISQSSISILS